MELGAIICKPKNPICKKCPLTQNCLSYRRLDFETITNNKKIIDRFFLIKIFKKKGKILLTKNTKFNFLKNLKIFPMEETSKPKNLKKLLKFKMSNMNMNIDIKKVKYKENVLNSLWIEQKKFNNYTLPTFTKKIFSLLDKYL